MIQSQRKKQPAKNCWQKWHRGGERIIKGFSKNPYRKQAEFLTIVDLFAILQVLKPPATPQGLCRLYIYMQYERAIIRVDGSNFYFKLRDLKLHQLLTFNFSDFAKAITGSRRLVSATYYV